MRRYAKNINTFLRGTIWPGKNSSLTNSAFFSGVFPASPKPKRFISSLLDELHRTFKERDIKRNMGSLYALPHTNTVDIYRQFIADNPNNLGDWSAKKPQEKGAQQFEYEVIQELIDLYRGDPRKLSGYITTGASESNIFLTWAGRSYIETYGKTQRICLIRTSLTHYSVEKAGRICRIPQFITPLCATHWHMDPKAFSQQVTHLIREGFRGFLVPLTLGYTTTGTSDPVEHILQEIRGIKKSHPETTFFVWIDAAFNGLITPFLSKHFTPFAQKEIQGIAVDFHKFGLVPYPGGVILYTNASKKSVSQPIPYLQETDATLLGSRSGVPAVCIWDMIHSLGKTGYRALVREQLENKKYFVKQFQATIKSMDIISDPYSLSCGLIPNNPNYKKFPPWMEEKYSMHQATIDVLFSPQTWKKTTMYTLFFLPHLTHPIVEEFITDCQSV